MIQTGTARQPFMNRIAEALGRKTPLAEKPSRTEIGPPRFWQEQRFDETDLAALFKTNLEALTGRVVFARTPEEVTGQVTVWLDEIKAKSIILWNHEDLKRYVNTEKLGRDIAVWDNAIPRKQLVEAAEKADVGITWANYAIAYTGSLALFSSPTQGRSVSLLPPTHIAVFRQSDIVATMSHVIRHLVERRSSGNLPAVVDFITGPSRTSDIEMDLSIGVHGPFRVWTIVVES